MLLKILVFVVPITVQASVSSVCPDLTGTYLCKQNSYRKDTQYTFQQSLQSDIWSYTVSANYPGQEVLSSYTLQADGKSRPVTDVVTGRTLTASAVCENSLLKVSGSAKAPNGQTINFYEELARTADLNLSNTSLDINGQVVAEVCERLQP